MAISSETAFIWRELKLLLMLPLTMLKVLLRRQRPSALFEPITFFFHFVTEPRATAALIAAIAGMFAYQVFLMPAHVFENLIFRPEHLYSLDIVPMAASWFLHGSLTHVCGNILFLFVFGRIVEARLGAVKMLIVYFGSGVISTVIAGIAGQGGIGASGAIAGLIATAVLINPFYLTYLFFGLPVPVFVIGWLALLADITGVLVPQNDSIGHIAHLGGYAAVTILVFLLSSADRRSMLKGLVANVLMLAALLAYLGFGPKLI